MESFREPGNRICPLWIPLLLLGVSLGLLGITADQGRRSSDLPDFVVGVASRILRYTGYAVLALSLLLFPATVGLAVIGFASTDSLLMPLAGAVAGPIMLVFGLLAMSPRKRIVLFLRRFGNEEINRAIRCAVRGRLGSTHRLVALDDLPFVTASSPPGPKILTASPIALTAVLALIAASSLASAVRTIDREPGELEGMEV